MNESVVRRLLIGLSFTVLSCSALAASPPMPVYSWTGFYIGGNVGAGWGTQTGNGTNTSVDEGGAFIGLPLVSSFNSVTHLRGGFGGGQFGYNYQLPNNWLLGVEVDVDGSTARGSSTTCGITISDPSGRFAPGSVSGCANSSTRADVFGSVRPRLGYVFSNWMVYGTGGWAWTYGTSNKQDIGVVSGGASSISAFLNGWAVGAGTEWQFLPHWTLRLEYLHTQVGPMQTNSSNSSVVAPLGVPFGLFEALNSNTKADSDAVRVGMNYIFD